MVGEELLLRVFEYPQEVVDAYYWLRDQLSQYALPPWSDAVRRNRQWQLEMIQEMVIPPFTDEEHDEITDRAYEIWQMTEEDAEIVSWQLGVTTAILLIAEC